MRIVFIGGRAELVFSVHGSCDNNNVYCALPDHTLYANYTDTVEPKSVVDTPYIM